MKYIVRTIPTPGNLYFQMTETFATEKQAQEKAQEWQLMKYSCLIWSEDDKNNRVFLHEYRGV
jgi:hypothetical protein